MGLAMRWLAILVLVKWSYKFPNYVDYLAQNDYHIY